MPSRKSFQGPRKKKPPNFFWRLKQTSSSTGAADTQESFSTTSTNTPDSDISLCRFLVARRWICRGYLLFLSFTKDFRLQADVSYFFFSRFDRTDKATCWRSRRNDGQRRYWSSESNKKKGQKVVKESEGKDTNGPELMHFNTAH